MLLKIPLLLSNIWIIFLLHQYLPANQLDKILLNGTYLGAFNSIQQKSLPDTASRGTQFDMAANLDVSWQVHRRVKGIMQLQMGSGLGSTGFAQSQVVVTDLNLEFELNKNLYLTAGSFDTPFGAETPYLTNNADASRNVFILNTLFYGAFAGTNVGTLNTIGMKGELKT